MPLKGKRLLEGLTDLNGRLNRAELRVARPSHIVFLCGGLISKNLDDAPVLSVRDYLYRVRQASKKVRGSIVLAETAQQLYRDTNYKDLISFEEDVARISSVVLVISESPGSLAELGAFASEPVIRKALRIIISEDHEKSDSFVRYGPVQRVENIKREYKGVFPWKNKSNGNLVKSSIRPHFREICKFINDRIDEIPASSSYLLLEDTEKLFYDIVWILSLFDLSPPEPLYEAVRVVHPKLTDLEIRDRLFVLKTCRWIESFSYSGKDYYYLPDNKDPFSYSFTPGQRPRDVAASKLEISTEFQTEVGISKAVRRRLVEKRGDGA